MGEPSRFPSTVSVASTRMSAGQPPGQGGPSSRRRGGGADDGPLVVDLEHDRAGKLQQGGFVGSSPRHVGAAVRLLVHPLERAVLHTLG